MAGWGALTPWGGISLWGTSGPGAHEICDLTETRILFQMDSTIGNRNFRDFMCIHAEPFGQFADVAQDVSDGFNLETAIGDQLDVIGRVIDLQRSGFDDDTYRTLLQMQATILQGQTDGDWTGSINQILSMIRTFIGAGGGPILYTPVPPYAFELTVPAVLTATQIKVLFRLICKAIYAGVLGFVTIVEPGPNLWDSAHGAATDSAIWCSAHGATATPCGQWATVIVTSSC